MDAVINSRLSFYWSRPSTFRAYRASLSGETFSVFIPGGGDSRSSCSVSFSRFIRLKWQMIMVSSIISWGEKKVRNFSHDASSCFASFFVTSSAH